MAKRKWTALAGDVFAGTFALGVQHAGFTLCGALEHSTYGRATRQLNFPKLATWQWKHMEATDFAQAMPLVGHVDLMFTNPPCAPWSHARHRRKGDATPKTELWKDDPRIEWVLDLANFGRMLGVKAWIWESIPQTWARGRVFIDWHARLWRETGYTTTLLLQNNMYCGGTQDRKRMMFIAHRYPLIFPPYTVPRTTVTLLQQVKSYEYEKRWLSAQRADVWNHAQYFHGSLVRAQRDLEQQGYKTHIGKQSFLDYRLMPETPPRVFMSDATRMHPTEPRYFTWDEMKALCGLPATWRSAEQTMNARALEISRAVLPGVGTWIATAICNGFKRRPLTQMVHQIIDIRHPHNATTQQWIIE